MHRNLITALCLVFAASTAFAAGDPIQAPGLKSSTQKYALQKGLAPSQKGLSPSQKGLSVSQKGLSVSQKGLRAIQKPAQKMHSPIQKPLQKPYQK